MMRTTYAVRRTIVGTALAGVIFTGIAWATAGSGTVSTLIGPAARFEAFKVRREAANGWELEIKAKQGVNVSTQSITFQPGGQSGWHTHPGPVFISVKEGTMTFYDENCVATVRMAGQGFLDTGTHPHIARNETGSPATNMVTYFAPVSATSLRVDAPKPPNCGF